MGPNRAVQTTGRAVPLVRSGRARLALIVLHQVGRTSLNLSSVYMPRGWDQRVVIPWRIETDVDKSAVNRDPWTKPSSEL
jgi:hypothetical protein